MKNSLFSLFSKTKSLRWDFYLKSQKSLINGHTFNKQCLGSLRNLIIQIHNKNERIKNSFNFLDEEGNQYFYLTSEGPILRHSLKIIFFPDEYFEFKFKNESQSLDIKGSIETIACQTNLILFFLDQCKQKEDCSFYIKVSPSKDRKLYESDLREILQRRRKEALASVANLKEDFKDIRFKYSLQPTFLNFGLDTNQKDWPTLIHSFSDEKLTDLDHSLSVFRQKVMEGNFVSQHIHQQWAEEIEDIWKKWQRL